MNFTLNIPYSVCDLVTFTAGNPEGQNTQKKD